MNHSIMLYHIAMALYFVAGVAFLRSLAVDSKRAARVAFPLALVGVMFHTAGLVTHWVVRQMAPFTNLFGALMFFAWALVMVYLLSKRSSRITSLGVFVLLVSAGTMACAMFLPRDVTGTLIPALQSRWSVVHIASALISYAGFVLAFGSAMAYSLQDRMLKAKRINVLRKYLPPLDVLDQIAYRLVAFSFPMLTLGIITGALWAQDAWGSYWRWDPKEIWALITWLIYAAYLHVRVVQGWQGKWANRLLLIGFACVIITFLGVNFFSQGRHIYNW